MPRSMWTGTISFGLVNVPVKLFSATQDKDVSFHQFQEGTGERIRNKRVAEGTGDEVDYKDIVKGYEISDGEYVIVTPEELEAVEPGKSRSIEIETFIDLDEIDPIYFQKSYYLAPANDSAAKPYVLLRSAMESSRRAGVARFVMRSKQYLAAIRPAGDALVLETMFFADEVRDPAQIDELGAVSDDIELSEREKTIAAQLIDSLTSEWDPEQYRDTYRDRVLELIERKAKGEDVVTERPKEDAAVIDLMAALERSVEEARQGRRPGQSGNGHRSDRSEDGGSGRWEDAPKDDLYEEAQRRNIEGRSKMSKQELIEALQKAS